MLPARYAKCTIAIAVVLTLAACSSDSDDTDNETIDSDEQTTGTDTDNTTPDPTALFGPAQYIVSDCGSLAVSSAVPDNSLTAPAQLIVGEPVRGQIVPDSVDDNFHTWQVSLEPGNYHLVADVSVLNESQDSIGLEITALGATTDENEDLASDYHSGLDLRIYEFLEIQAARTITMRIDAGYDSIHNYALGIFANGTAVPSPTIESCLPINALSTDTTVSVDLQGGESRDDDRWYSIDLAEQEYVLDASTSSAEQASIGYEFDLFEQFGQTDAIQNITAEFLSGTELTSSDTFEPATGGASWIRLRNGYDSDRTVEFTVSTP